MKTKNSLHLCTFKYKKLSQFQCKWREKKKTVFNCCVCQKYFTKVETVFNIATIMRLFDQQHFDRFCQMFALVLKSIDYTTAIELGSHKKCVHRKIGQNFRLNFHHKNQIKLLQIKKCAIRFTSLLIELFVRMLLCFEQKKQMKN